MWAVIHGAVRPQYLAVLALLAVAASVSPASTMQAPASAMQAPASAMQAPSQPLAAGPTGAWTVYHRDDGHTGHDPNLGNLSSVSTGWTSATLDEEVYAEPLISNGIVYTATLNNTVYALKQTDGTQVWSQNLGAPETTGWDCGNVSPQGILGTPVIDVAAGRIYVAAFFLDDTYHVFGLSLSTGAIQLDTTLNISGFIWQIQQQRGALALRNGYVYVPFGGRAGDCAHGGIPYHGYVVGVPTSGSAALAVYQTPVAGSGIWTAGGIVVDDATGNLFAATGNGIASGCGSVNQNDAVVRLSPGLAFQDYFMPNDWQNHWCSNDQDLGSASPLLISPSLLFQAGKWGGGFFLDPNHLGGVDGQLFPTPKPATYSQADVCFGNTFDATFGSFAYAAPFVYVECEGHGLVALRASTSAPSFSPCDATCAPPDWSAGGTTTFGPPIVAAGAVWVASNNNGLYAFNAATGAQIYHSAAFGINRFVTPAEASGQVFVPSGTVIRSFNMTVAPPATPSATDGTVLFTNQCSQSIGITGTSTAGSGFFGPAAGYPNPLTATVSGGVTVNRVTFVDPTHIILDLSTQGATAGLKNLTVTNPDGQSVTVNNFLSVTGPSTLPDSQSSTSENQYSLSNSDGATWVEIDPALRVSCTPVANQSTLLTANADLFTGAAGFNQDIGIFVSDNGGADTLLAWKESGGFAGVFSPNAAYVQWLYPMLAGHTYVFKLKWKTNKPAIGFTIYAAAGPGPFPWSNTSLLAETFATGVVPAFASSINQYNLPNSDGATWMPLDAALNTTVTAAAAGTIVVGGNVDLFTGKAGYNQDIAIFVSDNGTPDVLVAWKESGGFAGVFSPNAAFVKATVPAVSGHAYVFKLKWKTNKPAAGAIIYAAAGPGPSPWSQTSLVAQFVPASANTVFTSVSTTQYSLSNSDGTTWVEIDPALRVTVSPTANTDSILGANVDLFTGQAGYNQDVGIFVSINGSADTLLVWKESGGLGGVFSPNAAAAQTTFLMTTGHTYLFKLMWKTNKSAAGATIYAAAGPGPAPWSHTRLILEETV